MRLKLTKHFRTCSHAETMIVRSVGVERFVCEACGHVSFSFDVEPVGADNREPVTPIQALVHPAEM